MRKSFRNTGPRRQRGQRCMVIAHSRDRGGLAFTRPTYRARRAGTGTASSGLALETQQPVETTIWPALFVIGEAGNRTTPPPAMKPHVPTYSDGIG